MSGLLDPVEGHFEAEGQTEIVFLVGPDIKLRWVRKFHYKESLNGSIPAPFGGASVVYVFIIKSDAIRVQKQALGVPKYRLNDFVFGNNSQPVTEGDRTVRLQAHNLYYHSEEATAFIPVFQEALRPVAILQMPSCFGLPMVRSAASPAALRRPIYLSGAIAGQSSKSPA